MSKIKIVLTKNQWARISELLGNLGLLSLASIVIPFIFEKPNPWGFLLGLLSTILIWYASIVTARKY